MEKFLDGLLDWYVATVSYYNKEKYKDYLKVKSTYEQELRNLNRELMIKIQDAEQKRNRKK